MSISREPGSVCRSNRASYFIAPSRQRRVGPPVPERPLPTKSTRRAASSSPARIGCETGIRSRRAARGDGEKSEYGADSIFVGLTVLKRPELGWGDSIVVGV